MATEENNIATDAGGDLKIARTFNMNLTIILWPSKSSTFHGL